MEKQGVGERQRRPDFPPRCWGAGKSILRNNIPIFIHFFFLYRQVIFRTAVKSLQYEIFLPGNRKEAELFFLW
jgi:hypothetical protein